MGKNANAKSKVTCSARLHNLVKLASPEPRALKAIGKESVRHGTNNLSSAEIEQIIRSARAEMRKRIS